MQNICWFYLLKCGNVLLLSFVIIKWMRLLGLFGTFYRSNNSKFISRLTDNENSKLEPQTCCWLMDWTSQTSSTSLLNWFSYYTKRNGDQWLPGHVGKDMKLRTLKCHKKWKASTTCSWWASTFSVSRPSNTGSHLVHTNRTENTFCSLGRVNERVHVDVNNLASDSCKHNLFTPDSGCVWLSVQVKGRQMQ